VVSIVLPASPSVVYDVHRDRPHCLSLAPAFCSSTTSHAMRSVTARLPAA
jgi:hypothetical protein